MKISQLSVLIVLFLLSSSFVPRRKNNPLEFNIKQFDKNLCQVNDQLYAYSFEVSNADYRMFINEIKSSNKDWQILLPDTIQWNFLNKNSYCQPYVEHYYSHAAFRNYPVCNITYEQVISYCEWLTNKYNSQEKRKFNNVKFRLPNVEEWEIAARGGLEDPVYSQGGYYLRSPKGRFLYNFRRIGDRSITKEAESGELVVVKPDSPVGQTDGHYLHAPVDSYWPNGFGLYNMCGNAAEMVQKEFIAKGGSFNDPGYDIRIKSESKYEKPGPTIGFRVFMEVIEE